MSKHPTQNEIRDVLKRLKKRWQNPGAMEIGSAYRMLVAVLLSARTRDEQVLKLLPAFFEAFPDTKTLSQATVARIRSKISSIGMNNQKAKNLKKMAQRIESAYGGRIPNSMDDLVTLAGVGRKTASVILPYVFHKPAIAVDTHVHRVTNRLGWVHTKTPAQTEERLLKLIPKDVMADVNQVFVKHGRYLCITKPRCWACPIADVCAYKQKNLEQPTNASDILKTIEHREHNLEVLRKNVGKRLRT